MEFITVQVQFTYHRYLPCRTYVHIPTLLVNTIHTKSKVPQVGNENEVGTSLDKELECQMPLIESLASGLRRPNGMTGGAVLVCMATTLKCSKPPAEAAIPTLAREGGSMYT